MLRDRSLLAYKQKNEMDPHDLVGKRAYIIVQLFLSVVIVLFGNGVVGCAKLPTISLLKRFFSSFFFGLWGHIFHF